MEHDDGICTSSDQRLSPLPEHPGFQDRRGKHPSTCTSYAPILESLRAKLEPELFLGGVHVAGGGIYKLPHKMPFSFPLQSTQHAVANRNKISYKYTNVQNPSTSLVAVYQLAVIK